MVNFLKFVGIKGKKNCFTLCNYFILQPLFIELLFDKVYIIPYTAFIHVICFIIYMNQFIMYILDQNLLLVSKVQFTVILIFFCCCIIICNDKGTYLSIDKYIFR